MKSVIRLSQCMIVKNEEKNIRRALNWGKKIVCEQIVVDTGSTDRTVEIAREMGAKVFHFTWINDFSAAKNFAIEQAKGNWIAFLDADEYYSDEDAKKILPLLKQAEQKFTPPTRPHMIRSMLVDLNDSGEPFSTGIHDRIFRNLPGLRYRNRIHEVLCLPDDKELIVLDASKELAIYHTGYAVTSFKEKEKANRNLSLLKQEVEEKPDDYNMWSYLGDSLFAANRLEEAEAAYLRVIDNLGDMITHFRKNAAFCNLLKIKYSNHSGNEEEILSIYQKAKNSGCTSPDLEYWMGNWFYQQGEEQKGRFYFEQALHLLDHCEMPNSLNISSELSYVYKMIFQSYEKLDQPSEMVRYGVLALRADPYEETVLMGILSLLKNERGEEESASATFDFLGKLYNLSSAKDKFFLIKISKITSFSALEKRIYDLLSLEDRRLLNHEKQSDYHISEEERIRYFSGINCKNEIDQEFMELIKESRMRSPDEFLNEFQEKLRSLGKTYKGVENYYFTQISRFPFWGNEVVQKRIAYIQANTDDLIQLYGMLADYQSKKILLSILRSWLFLDTDRLGNVKKGQDEYFDLDLIPSGAGKNFVDAGAYNGDTVRLFIKAYGKKYRKIYCFEASDEMTDKLQQNLQAAENIVVSPFALDSGNGEKHIVFDKEDPSISYLSQTTGDMPVKTASLDGEVTERIDILKININGYEMQALLGAQEHIRKEHPFLLIALYHHFEDLTKIPKMIMDMEPDYKLYLRYYGGDLIPTNFILYAI